MSMSDLAVNSWTSNPVSGVMFEIQLPSLRVVGVDGSGVAVEILVSHGSWGRLRSLLELARGEGPTPLNYWVGWGEGHIFLVDGY